MYHINPHTVIDDRIVIAMVGLPARGKSYISKAIVRYLTFLGCPVKLFNAGNKRRDHVNSAATGHRRTYTCLRRPWPRFEIPPG